MAGYRFLTSSVRPVARSSAARIRAYSQKVEGNKNGGNQDGGERTELVRYTIPAGICVGIGLAVCYIKFFRDKDFDPAARAKMLKKIKELQQSY